MVNGVPNGENVNNGAMVADPWGQDPLGWLLSPNTGADFLANFYEKKPLIVLRDEPERFSSLLSLAAIDKLIAGTDLKEGQIDLANASRNLTRAQYIDGNGYVDRGAVVKHFRQGATIILQQLHALDPVLSRFCAVMESQFSCHVQNNIYLTPPSNQGFRTHYDNHDVIVVQIEGEKAWRFYNSYETPYRGEGYNSRAHEVGEVTEEFVLKAGDVCYLPRGLMHDARTSGDSPSLHITMGIMVKTWAELMLEAVSEVALREPKLRRGLPAGYARPDFDRSAWQGEFAEMAAIIGQELKLDPAMDLYVDNFVRTRGADTRGGILSAQRPLNAQSPLKRRFFAPYVVETSSEHAICVTAGGPRRYPLSLLESLNLALNGAVFTPAALAKDQPIEAILEMCEDLLAYGMIEPA